MAIGDIIGNLHAMMGTAYGDGDGSADGGRAKVGYADWAIAVADMLAA